uniref:GATA-type domain-containing protein n=1 Tax=Rhinopithecus bieti TaxID=61621 RepID=A0A2K6M8U4_RHIBE
MTEEKRALELDATEDDVKRLLASDLNTDKEMRVTPEPGAGPAQGLLRATGATTVAVGRGEGLVGDGPVDMPSSYSDTKSERRPPSPDVIVLSHNEQPSSPRENVLIMVALETSTEALMKSNPKERERMFKQLKEELRFEEAKLLRTSQIRKEATTQKPAGSVWSAMTTPPPLVRGTQNIPAGKPSLQISSARMFGSVISPPQVRGGQQASLKLGLQANSQVVMSPLVRGAQQIHSFMQHSSTGPPPLLLAPRVSVPSVQIQGQRIVQQGLIRIASVPNTSLLVNIPQPTPASLKGTTASYAQANSTPTSVASVVTSTESSASRQAAAKLVLRKQLEKTLLEMPHPSPSPGDELSAQLPNNEFIYLVGLEEVVQNLLETQAVRMLAAAVLSREPYMCAHCKMDFTCHWREEKSGAIMCENCMTTNQKKALKVEHTSRLKAAFVKALQQEQEIEQQLLQQGTASAAPAKAEAAAAPHPTPKQVVKLRRRLAFHSGESNGAVPQAFSLLSRGVLHTFSPSPKLQNSALATALGSGTSNWNTGGTLAFVSPSLVVHKSSSAVDRQREYLLDIIPPRSIPSQPRGNSASQAPWKTGSLLPHLAPV